jgi:hypothetical protein
MNYLKSIKIIKQVVLLVTILSCPLLTFSQQTDSTKEVSSFMAAVNVTNNGISLLPNFSLGKPAVIFNMIVAKKRLSFEPEMRFAIEGAKPWSFIFWWRYKILKTNKFSFNVGAHPSFVFREKNLMIDGTPHDVLTAQRYLATECVPTYALANNLTVGVYYLHSFGLNEDASKSTDFVALRGNISNIPLSNQFFLKISPQLYYLNIDGIEGTYVTSALTLSKKNCPLFISSIMSKAIKSDIAGKDFVWNISLHYAFNKNYVGL